MKELLDKYFDLQKQIYDYFGYTEDWRIFPIVDDTQYFWALNQEKTQVKFVEAENQEHALKILAEIEEGDIYGNEIYTYRHLEKYIYETADYTMMLVDTRTDGNIFLQIFDNNKRLN